MTRWLTEETLAERKVRAGRKGEEPIGLHMKDAHTSLSEVQPVCELALLSSFRHGLGVIPYCSR